MIKVLFVCHGNICRSPMAEFLMKHTVKNLNASNSFLIESKATSSEEYGNPVHPGAKRKLLELGIDASQKRAELLKKSDYENYDYIIGMDSYNIKNMKRILGEDYDGKIYKLLDFTENGGDIADPYYSGNFEDTYNDIINGIIGFLKTLQEKKVVALWE